MAGRPLPFPESTKDLILSIDDLKEVGSKKLPIVARGKRFQRCSSGYRYQVDLQDQLTLVWSDFFNSGSAEQVTLAENTSAFSKYRLRPRVLRDVSGINTTTTVFGQNISFPLCMSPTGLHALAHPDGELATARACATRHVHMGVSSMANRPIESIRKAGTAIWPGIANCMQIYTMKDKAKEEHIIRRAEAAGCAALLLTADSPVLGVRYNEQRNNFRIPEGMGFPIVEKPTAVLDGKKPTLNFVKTKGANM